ncbi:MAG: hypothetical protein ACYC3B_06210 [Sedimentisphaerales bacterium]
MRCTRIAKRYCFATKSKHKPSHSDIKDKVMENYKVFFDNLTINLYEWRTYERKALT